jgi:hypothetical protein
LTIFQGHNNWLYKEIGDVIRNKYKELTPVVIQFISTAQSFFSKAGQSFSRLSQIYDKSKQIGSQAPEVIAPDYNP